MKTEKNRNLLISFLISLSLTGLCLYWFYPSEGIPGIPYVISVLAQFTFLILGPILFVFRISGFLRRENFFYIFLAVANSWLSIISFLLYFLGKVDKVMVWAFLPNLFIGILLLIDIYWARTARANTRSR
jgi:hypothetical protein